MKLIWVAPECPYPANTGGRVGIWKRITEFSKKNEIYLFCVIDELSELEEREHILSVCREVHMYTRQSKIKSLFHAICTPYPAISRWNENLKKDIEVAYNRLCPDFVIVDFPQMIGVLSKKILHSGKVVLNQHNIEYLALKDLTNSFDNLIKKVIYNFVSWQMYKYENNIYRNFNILLYTFVSSKDKEMFEKLYGIKNTFLVPVGADVQTSEIIDRCHNVLFVANFQYSANEEAALWIIENIWPAVSAKFDDAKLYLVGKNPTDKMYAVAKGKENIVITGLVESVKRYYDMCNVVLVPIFTGGGVNVKLIEALGFGKIVISTSKGIEGTQFRDREEVIIADTIETFVEETINILNDPIDYMEIRENALRKMTEVYSWASIIEKYEEYLRGVREEQETD